MRLRNGLWTRSRRKVISTSKFHVRLDLARCARAVVPMQRARARIYILDLIFVVRVPRTRFENEIGHVRTRTAVPGTNTYLTSKVLKY